MTAPTRRLLPEVAAAALSGVLVARPAAQVRHVAVTTGLTGTGRLRRGERPLCGRAGRAWSARRGRGLPLCRLCEHRTRVLAGRDGLVAAARTLTALDLSEILGTTTTLDDVETVAGLLAASGPALRTALVPGRWGTEPLQTQVRHARDRLTPRDRSTQPTRRAQRGTTPLVPDGTRMYPTRYSRAARRAS